MDKSDVLGYAKKVVPWIAAAATGNVPALITMAADAVSTVLGVKVDPTGDAITAAVARATPAEVMQMKAMDNDFQFKMKELGYKQAAELEAGAYADMASARARDTDLMKTTGKTNQRASVMLAVTMLMLIALVGVMLYKDIDANTALGGVILLLIGKFSNAWDTAFTFEFGTTRSSKGKDDTIKAMVDK